MARCMKDDKVCQVEMSGYPRICAINLPEDTKRMKTGVWGKLDVFEPKSVPFCSRSGAHILVRNFRRPLKRSSHLRTDYSDPMSTKVRTGRVVVPTLTCCSRISFRRPSWWQPEYTRVSNAQCVLVASFLSYPFLVKGMAQCNSTMASRDMLGYGRCCSDGPSSHVPRRS